MNGVERAGVVAIAAVAAVAIEVVAAAPVPVAIGDAAAGAALLAVGALTLTTPRGRATGALLLLTGALWLGGTLWGGLVFLHRGPLVHLVLAYPQRWPRSRVSGIVIVSGYACAIVTPVARSPEATIALAVALVVTAALRHGTAGGVERRARAAALAAAVLLGSALALAAVGRLAGGSIDDFALWSYNVAVTLTAIGLGADLLWGRWERAAVSELVADLGAFERGGALRERLARTLGDPDLLLGFARGDGYADEAGRAVSPFPQEGRAVSFVEDGGRPVAALVHDAGLLADERLLATALAAVRLGAANERMLAEVREGVKQLEGSRRRLVEAAIDQRRAIEQELRAGAERRLDEVAGRLRAVGGLDELVGDVEQAQEELRRFAQGIHPVVLTERGLLPALSESAALMSFDVGVVAPAERLPPSVEVTIYFLCVEALTNIGKHAAAGRASIRVEQRDGTVEVTVEDDGVGGAALDRGTGLRGLADRIAALGGALDVHSPEQGGTRLHARIPI